MHKELGSGTRSVVADRSGVIDVGAKGTYTGKDYSAPALFITEMTSWAIPKTTIPIDPNAVCDWEDKGKGISKTVVPLLLNL